MSSLVSIIIPTFNNGSLLSETLNSLLNQTLANWEVLVIDDDSDDNTLQIAGTFASSDSRITALKRPENLPKGANVCRNYGLLKASGEYVIFLDADDLLIPNALKRRVALFEINPDYQALVFSTRVVSYSLEEKNILNNDPEDVTDMDAYAHMFMRYEIPWQITGPIWKRDTLKVFGGFNTTFQRFQDVEFHTRLLLKGVKVLRVFEADFLYRSGPEGTSKYLDSSFIKKALKAILRYVDTFAKPLENSTITTKQRKDSLRVMMLKTYTNFILKKEFYGNLEGFLKTARRTQLFSFKECYKLWILYIMTKHKLYQIKGVGMYRYYANLKNKFGL